MEVLIHIGYPKTATTWLQHCFFPNIRNVHYFSKESNFLQQILEQNAYGFDARKVLEEYKQFGDKKIIISNEDLLGSVNYSWHNGFIGKEISLRIKEAFPKAQIVLFIRNQLDMFVSVYMEYIKSGGTKRFSDFFKLLKDSNYYGRIQLSSMDYLRYDLTISHYQDLFGVGNVHVYLFEEFKENPNIFMNDLTHKFGLEIDLKAINFEPKNSRLRKGLVKFLRFNNHFTAKNTSYKYYFLNLPFIYTILNGNSQKLNTWSVFGRKVKNGDILKEKETEYIKAYYRESNRKLIDKLGYNAVNKYSYPL